MEESSKLRKLLAESLSQMQSILLVFSALLKPGKLTTSEALDQFRIYMDKDKNAEISHLLKQLRLKIKDQDKFELGDLIEEMFNAYKVLIPQIKTALTSSTVEVARMPLYDAPDSLLRSLGGTTAASREGRASAGAGEEGRHIVLSRRKLDRQLSTPRGEESTSRASVRPHSITSPTPVVLLEPVVAVPPKRSSLTGQPKSLLSARGLPPLPVVTLPPSAEVQHAGLSESERSESGRLDKRISTPFTDAVAPAATAESEETEVTGEAQGMLKPIGTGEIRGVHAEILSGVRLRPSSERVVSEPPLAPEVKNDTSSLLTQGLGRIRAAVGRSEKADDAATIVSEWDA